MIFKKAISYPNPSWGVQWLKILNQIVENEKTILEIFKSMDDRIKALEADLEDHKEQTRSYAHPRDWDSDY